MALDPAKLEALDEGGYTVIEAVTHAGVSPTNPNTHARPNAFVCIDGKTYWVKAQAQQGLVAELIVGRLAGKLGAGALAKIVHVSDVALRASGLDETYRGIVVGIEDIKKAINARDLEPFRISGQFQPRMIDERSRARVTVFQSWIGVSDQQVMVQLDTGSVFTIDHGDAFGDGQLSHRPRSSCHRDSGSSE